MNFLSSESLKPEVNLVSLVDVVLLLVIFFMLTTHFVLQSGIRVNLPQTKTQDTESARELSLTLTKKGKLYLNQQPVTLKNLPTALKQYLKQKPGSSLLIIKADKDVRHGQVVRVMDIAKRAGIARLAIATEVVGAKE